MTEQPTTSTARSDDLAAADPAVEPGHRARALAASLLGELTGQRRTFSGVGPAPADEPDADAGNGLPPRAGAVQRGPAAAPDVAPRPPEPAAAPRDREPEKSREREQSAPEEAAPAALATQAPAPVAPTVGPTTGGQRPERRPAPFLYAAVAGHHTSPARATANGALDTAGTRISSRVDRDQVRRAAQVALEAASLADACDVLDARAAAADGTWTGERHSTTEVREFDGAWGAFYDAQAALARHVGS